MLIGHKETLADLARLAEESKLASGYIFWGADGTGKKQAALDLATYLETGAWAETDKVLQDLLLTGPVERSIGIDAVRDAQRFLWEKPNVSKYRVLIVDDANRLTPDAQNALLKIAEEPPSYGVIFLISDSPESFLPTLRSRLQKMYFGPVPEADIAAWLGEKGMAKKEAQELAKKCFGRPGLAWRMHSDEKLKAGLAAAGKFLGTSGFSRKEFLKGLIGEEFMFLDFLDALLIVLGASPENNSKMIHRVLELREKAGRSPLNPRIQLLNL